MRGLVSFGVLFVLVIGASRLAGPARPLVEGARATQGVPACEGQWRLQLTYEGRDAVEEAIGVFGRDGSLILYTVPVLAALPGMGDAPVYASDAVGTWARGSGVHCTFDVVRLLAAEDGAPLGALNLRGGIVLDLSGPGLSGVVTYDQSSGTGRTVASGSGALVGTSLSP